MVDSPVDYYDAAPQAQDLRQRWKSLAAEINRRIHAWYTRRTITLIGLVFGLLATYVVVDYARYHGWLSFNDVAHVREYVPANYPVADAHYYRFRNMVYTWELYRFNTSVEAVAKLAERLQLSSQGKVSNFSLIITQPPPYWWHPEALASAELFAARQGGPDGKGYEMLYAEDTGTVYLMRFEG